MNLRNQLTDGIQRFPMLLTALVTGLLCLAAPSVKLQGANGLSVTLDSNQLFVSAEVHTGAKEIELILSSDRNERISRMSDVSERNPERREARAESAQRNHDIWYPIVDIALLPGMEGVAEFSGIAKDTSVIINGPWSNEWESLPQTLLIPAEKLEEWENSLHLSDPSVALESFELRIRLPVVAGRVEQTFATLSPKWSGSIRMIDVTRDDSPKPLERQRVENAPLALVEAPGGDPLSKARLLAALRDTVDLTKRFQVKDPVSPVCGGLWLFYDLDAATYRTSYWMWGWGPSIKMLIDASKVEDLALKPEPIVQLAKEIGKSSLRFIYNNPESPVHEMVMSRWIRNLGLEKGYRGALTAADALFLVGWGWIPLYEETGDARYLEASQKQCEIVTDLLQTHKLIPHSWFTDDGTWRAYTIDETGFGMEGYAEVYRLTQNPRIKDGGRKFIQGHIETFERDDGSWDRKYTFATKKLEPSLGITRGLGWAMEGLLAAHRLMPDEGYLEKAIRMGSNTIASQQSDGSWNFRYDDTLEEAGVADKGTPLWSLLLYMLYEHSQDSKHLEAARKALGWCIENMYYGPDPEAIGGIFGRNRSSGVGYRNWYNLACVYSSGFLGLSILEELKLIDQKL